MNKHITFVLIFLFLLCFGNSFASVYEHEIILDKNVQELPILNNIKCKFRQEKQISGMLLKSYGDFEFDKNKGVIFYTTYPIKSTTSYTSKEYKQINSIITSVSNKSYSRLQKDFRFYYEKSTQTWTMALMPKKESVVYNYLKSIEIEGDESMINKIIILNCDNTKTTIWFNK